MIDYMIVAGVGFALGMMIGITMTLFLLFFRDIKRKVDTIKFLYTNRKRLWKLWKGEEK